MTNVDENRNAVNEAGINKISIAAFSNTNSDISGVDLIIPMNITNKNSIEAALWLILNEIKKLKKEKPITLEEFMGKE